MQEKIQKFKSYRNKLEAYSYCFWLISWDQETETPVKGYEFQGKNFSVLLEESYNIETNPEYVSLLEELYEKRDTLTDELLKVEVKKLYKNLRIIKSVPKDEFLEYQTLTQKACVIWAEAKKSNDFNKFAPTLEKIIVYQRKLTKYIETEELKGYDVLLDMYESGMTMKDYDQFFEALKEKLVPFVIEKTAKKPKVNKKLLNAKYDIEKQKEFSDYLLNVLHFDKERGLLKESVHPFTSGLASSDIRITTTYHENDVLSNIFSVIHETGHAIYEQQTDSIYDGTVAFGGASMGVHESQSRLYENMIGRSYAFWQVHYPKLQELFPKQLKKISLDEFYAFVNKTERSLIRINADELTYSLHIMVRYEIEKGLISGKIKVADLPKKWNQLMYKYLKVRPKTDTEGVLQDIHWSGGAIGYFPTYALGSAYAAQIYAVMDKDIDITKQILGNKIDNINSWLKTRIHQYGGSIEPKEVIKNAVKGEFNPEYYVNYLMEKYKNL